MPEVIKIPDLDHVVERYRSGASIKQLAGELGVARGTLTKRLRDREIPVRDIAAAGRVVWSELKRDRRAVEAQCGSAWGSCRGSTVSAARMQARAEAREIALFHPGYFEDEIDAELQEAGCFTRRMYPVGPYSVNLAFHVDRVAVEVSANFNYRHRKALDRDRVEYILDQRWAVLFIFHSKNKAVLPHRMTEEAIAFLEAVREDQSMLGHYGMVWSDGELVASAARDLPRRPRVEGF